VPVLRDGLVIKGFNAQTYIYPNTIASYASSNGVFTVTTSEAGNAVSYGIGYMLKCGSNRSFVVSLEATDGVVDVTWLDVNGYRISYKILVLYNTLLSKTITSPANAEWMILNFRNNSISTTKTYTKPMVCAVGAEATSYEPYFNGGTTQAPAPLFAVGNAADEYEAVSGVTTHKMASVDLGTLNFVYNSGGAGYWRYDRLSNLKPSPSSATAGNFMAVNYVKASSSNVVGGSVLNSIGVNNSSPNGYIYVYNGSSTTPPSGMFYYETIEPTTSQSTPTQISLQAGNNVALQTDGGRTLEDLSMTYENLPAAE
jgi:hypothetical protein